MKGLIFQGKLENPGGTFLVFKNGIGILKTKVKENPTIKKHINFNTMWVQDAVPIKTILKLQLRWLFRGPAPARFQPGETFPRKKASSSLQPCQPIQQSLFHAQNFLWFAPVWREGTFWPLPQHKVTHQLQWWGKPLMSLLPTYEIIQPQSAGVAPRRKVTNCTTAETPLVGKFGLLGELVVGGRNNYESRLAA